MLDRAEVDASAPRVRAAGDVYHSRRVRRSEEFRQDEAGEEERAEVVCCDLVLEAVGGEAEGDDGGRGVVDEDLGRGHEHRYEHGMGWRRGGRELATLTSMCSGYAFTSAAAVRTDSKDARSSTSARIFAPEISALSASSAATSLSGYV
jgi:hypothetical protein